MAGMVQKLRDALRPRRSAPMTLSAAQPTAHATDDRDAGLTTDAGATTDAGSTTDAGLQRRQNAAESAYRQFPARSDRVFKHFWGHVEKAGVTSGHVVEIGGRANPLRQRLDPQRFRYTAFDIVKTDEDTVVADITGCPQIPDGYCDVVVSVDVFEHINRPWLAAAEIARILKPGGIAYTSTLFSWRYHPCPIDYWRFTPDCLTFLFAGLDCVEAGFDATERRRNILGRSRNRLEPDAFGGWRENWRVFHVGRKPG